MTQPKPIEASHRIQPVLLVTVVAVAAGLAALALGLRASPALGSSGSVRLTDPDVVFVSAATEDQGVDPGSTKDVADCRATLEGTDTVVLDIASGYPGYTCHLSVIFENVGDAPLLLAAPVISTTGPELTVTPGNPACGELDPGGHGEADYSLRINQFAAQGATYQFSIATRFVPAELGSIGYWKNWDSHGTYASVEVEGWLVAIDASSDWLGPTTTVEMATLFDATRGRAGREARFLVQYLATRLNESAGLLCASEKHDLTSLDRDNYLGLEDSEHAGLWEIIEAVESKARTSPTRQQYDLLKSLLDGLNNASF
jgi:hypothetical protein